ncbi:hypothetical protein CWI38_0764p0020 [Hamiltosporidium tvaerminnensis]|uniref:Uncharacterized protein n=1 Tax=Hamiltosporidium tvaerminnensis TaxID=1176355 RepID=A0A4Q9LUT1_9MICR|nr:hypothetical protein CWI38_0764p0020 [Hamiltosporidium tvaerminnensis]
MLISNSTINGSILSLILGCNFLKTLNFFNNAIRFDINELKVDCNTSISKLIFYSKDTLNAEIFLTFVSFMRNLESLSLTFFNGLKNLYLNVDSEISTFNDLYFIQYFVVTESLVFRLKYSRKFQNDFFDLLSDDLTHLNIGNLIFDEENRRVLKNFKNLSCLRIFNGSFKMLHFNELFSSCFEYKLAEIDLNYINITIEDKLFMKKLTHLKKQYFKNLISFWIRICF